MSVYRRLVYPGLSLLDPEHAHELALGALARTQRFAPGRALLRLLAGSIPTTPVHAFGLTFPNVLGVAAGFDKDVRVAAGLGELGFGHVEVGTITPREQPGNPRPRIFRLSDDDALINRMGFPNAGIDQVRPRLQHLARSPRPRDMVIGVSLGKQKSTELEDAHVDYTAGMRAFYGEADYFAVNVSSPNTPGLRELQGGQYLEHLMDVLVAANRHLATKHEIPPRPLLVKIAPDVQDPELEEILEAALAREIAGIIATNTTLQRTGLRRDPKQQGGLSGAPLADRSTEVIRFIHRYTEGRLPVIGVGGVRTAEDVRAKLEAGASLVQLYTGLVYEGPGVAGRILRRLARGV